MIRVDGDDVQVSYQDHLGCWLIASNNVSVLARDAQEVQPQTQPIAEAWFHLLQKMKGIIPHKM